MVVPGQRKAGRVNSVEQVRIGHLAHGGRKVDDHLPRGRTDHGEDIELLLIGPEARHALLQVHGRE